MKEIQCGIGEYTEDGIWRYSCELYTIYDDVEGKQRQSTKGIEVKNIHRLETHGNLYVESTELQNLERLDKDYVNQHFIFKNKATCHLDHYIMEGVTTIKCVENK